MKGRFEGIKKVFTTILSIVALLVIGWFLYYGKTRASGFLPDLIGKIPKDESGLTKITNDVLGVAVEKVKNGDFKQAVIEGGKIFEKSEYSEPAKEIKEGILVKINEVLEEVKKIPGKELIIIKRQIYKQWFEDMEASESAK